MNFAVHCAPMMGYTDKHFITFMRYLAPKVQVTTEMISLSALVRDKCISKLDLSQEVGKIVLQIGGANINEYKRIAAHLDFSRINKININAGCPSDAVCKGGFGASFIENPNLLIEIVLLLKQLTNIPISVKTRIGLTNPIDKDHLYSLLNKLQLNSCDEVVLHARSAILGKLNPSQNRTVPPLQYEIVSEMKQHFPTLPIIINGGIKSLQLARQQKTKGLDGVMIGRAMITNPLFLRTLQEHFYNEPTLPLQDGINRYLDYGEALASKYGRLERKYYQPLSLICSHLSNARQIRHQILNTFPTLDDLRIIMNAIISELTDKPDSV